MKLKQSPKTPRLSWLRRIDFRYRWFPGNGEDLVAYDIKTYQRRKQ